jgi:hypothetical protein
MGIPIAGSFTLGSPTPIDDRVVVNNFSDLNSIPNRYEGLTAYAISTQTLYIYKGLNIWQPVGEQVPGGPQPIRKIFNAPQNFTGVSFINEVKSLDFLPTNLNTGQTLYLYNGNLNNTPKYSIVNVGVYEVSQETSVTESLSNINLTGIYQGLSLKRLKFHPTIGNGYKEFVLNTSASNTNPPICRPLAKQLETFYDVNIPSGGVGGTRYIKFTLPKASNFVQSQILNMRFNFEADNNPCVVNCFHEYGGNNTFYTVTGTNFNFNQKARVILKYGDKYADSNDHKFMIW